MDIKLELVFVPVTDVDRAKAFYVDQVGFHADFDQVVNAELRFVQLTPPGSACSIAFGTGLGLDMSPGSQQGIQCVVADTDAARAELVGRGVDASEVDEQPWGRFVRFADPDGNGWVFKQVVSDPASSQRARATREPSAAQTGEHRRRRHLAAPLEQLGERQPVVVGRRQVTVDQPGRVEARPGTVHPAADHPAAEQQHWVAVPVVQAAGGVLAHPAAELRERHQRHPAQCVSEVGRERRECLAELGELPGHPAAVGPAEPGMHVPVAEVDGRDPQADVGLDELGHVAKRVCQVTATVGVGRTVRRGVLGVLQGSRRTDRV